ncbi:branched-chain amino acid transport system ATP-binding protein [Roseovarius azorensis]|uniref:Branched-chain amino acid transport system ATP-binding protein n=1 Tax=Roseovarius azorensis TaxID=1287727 RepID=A0A1H7Y332_9RHOB|nr:ABC transporter ATP-binding protein [Roseovarius azorensis]SEM40284.1 branched-chain amino acid transport system ATP-binding protein [Roseovarius azorensis]
MSALLEATDMWQSFGGVQAVRGMSLEVSRGTITGLIGPNGAGKSTLFNLLSGVIRPDAGQVSFKEQDITRLAPWRRARLGLIRTFQLAREFQRMTVLENLMFAPQLQLGENFWPIFLRPGAVCAQEAEVYRRACEVMEIATLTNLRDDYAGDLSGGQKKLLELARTLMIDCDLILLDEPGAGVNPALMNTLTDMIWRLNREHGKTFLIVEHDMDMIAQLCDPVVVMTQGSLLTKGGFDDLRRDPAVIEAYLGSVANG